VLFAGRPRETDLSPGAWVAESLAGEQWTTLASLLPRSFEAHARVLHPAVRYVGNDDVEVSWAEVAAHNGTVAHPHMAWVGITGAWDYAWDEDNQPPVWDRAPDEGHLPTTVAARLVDVLRRHSGTPDDCWFGVWTGFTWDVPEAPELGLPKRPFWLVRGPIDLATANMAPEPMEQSASVWWPADRAWCVVTDIDLMSTYVGGSPECIAELLAAPGLEAVPAGPDDSVSYGHDPINPVPERE
jgi:hypothetical protein